MYKRQAQYPNASTIKQPTYYDIPPEALKDDRFAAMMEEATKYIGYPYVWGGSSPSTSFDCSGYISWVLNHSGWNVGRQTAQGLYNLCTPVSAAQVKPGDLVFFKGTYDTPGVSRTQFPLCLFHGLVGLDLVVPDAAADDLGGLILHKFFTLVATLHTHIFVFDFMDFSVSEQQRFRQWAAGRVWFQSGRAFVLLLKTQGGFRLAADSIVDFSLDRNTLFRQSGAGCIQFVGFRSRLLDIRLQRRVWPYFLGQLKPGGWQVCGGLPLGGGSLGLFCVFLGFVPVMGIVGPFQQLFRCAASLRGIVLFSLPAGNVLNLAGGLISSWPCVITNALTLSIFSLR